MCFACWTETVHVDGINEKNLREAFVYNDYQHGALSKSMNQPKSSLKLVLCPPLGKQERPSAMSYSRTLTKDCGLTKGKIPTVIQCVAQFSYTLVCNRYIFSSVR